MIQLYEKKRDGLFSYSFFILFLFAILFRLCYSVSTLSINDAFLHLVIKESRKGCGPASVRYLTAEGLHFFLCPGSGHFFTQNNRESQSAGEGCL